METGQVRFPVTGVSYIGEPVPNTAMFVGKKVAYLLEKLKDAEQCLVFVEEGIEVPEAVQEKNCIVFEQNPQLAYARFEVDAVNHAARKYNELLAGSRFGLPAVPEGMVSSWAQYTLRLPEGEDRAALQAKLKVNDIPSMVYYAKPMHQQGAFAGTRSAQADCPVTEMLCDRVLSLPMGPYMTDEDIRMVAETLLQE